MKRKMLTRVEVSLIACAVILSVVAGCVGQAEEEPEVVAPGFIFVEEGCLNGVCCLWHEVVGRLEYKGFYTVHLSGCEASFCT